MFMMVFTPLLIGADWENQDPHTFRKIKPQLAYFISGYHLIYFFPKWFIQYSVCQFGWKSFIHYHNPPTPFAHAAGLALTIFPQSTERERAWILRVRGNTSCCCWWYKPNDIKLCIESHYIKVIETRIITLQCGAASEVEKHSLQATFPTLFKYIRPLNTTYIRGWTMHI